MPESNTRALMILFLPQEWKNYHRRPHWEAMAVHSKILIIEPPAGILTAWLRPRRLLDYFRLSKNLPPSNSNLIFFRPIQLLSPGVNFLFPLFSAFDRFWMKRQLKKVLEQLKSEFDVAISFLSQVQQYHYSKIIPDNVQCYEIFDLNVIPYGHHKLDETNWYTKRARKHDRQITADSEIVVTSSKLIYDDLKSSVQKVHYLHNSADYKHFAQSAGEVIAIPDDIKMIPKPIFGFIGYMNHLLDYELITKLSMALPVASFLLIGSEQRITNVTYDIWYQKTKSISNIYYLGFKEYESLPNYLKGFDVCLLPFNLNDWMRYSAPNKTYQYLSSGKPIVATNFTEMESVKEVVYIANNHDEFIEMARVAVNEKDEEIRKRRQKVALENSTENRAVKMMAILNNFLEKRS